MDHLCYFCFVFVMLSCKSKVEYFINIMLYLFSSWDHLRRFYNIRDLFWHVCQPLLELLLGLFNRFYFSEL